MDRSAAGTRNLRCLNCGTETVFRIWEIVDINERPDLYKKIVTGTLFDAHCPNCKEFILKIDSPLLVYRSDQEPNYVYSPAEEPVKQVDQTHFMRLMENFRSDLGPEWPRSAHWVSKAPVPREVLSIYLRDGSTAADAAYEEIDRQKKMRDQEIDPLILNLVRSKTREQARRLITDNFSLITDFRTVGIMNELIFLTSGKAAIPEEVVKLRDQLIHYREIGQERTLMEFEEERIVERNAVPVDQNIFQKTRKWLGKIFTGSAKG